MPFSPFAATLLSLVPGGSQDTAPPVVLLDRDDVVVTESCTVRVVKTPIVDANGDGVLHVATPGVVLDWEGELRGAAAGTSPDAYEGIGVRVTAPGVTLRGARVSGFRGGIWATGADGLVLERCDVSDNRRQRLRSTPEAEDLSDWLWPHANEENEWLAKYGAGIYVDEATGITIRGCRARDVQNGICLREVTESAIYDNDMSFLSGWGLALFRASRNEISHNSFDFCVRGYSHGVYSRGQDSAGILAFEQCCDNVIAFNSATHSGDGFFGFAGLEALEDEATPPRTGNNGNLLYGNDLSYAPAIGIEMTFSFDNVFARNRLVGGNYGVWGGYSKATDVLANEIADNEIAGVAVEHGSGWRILHNAFARNRRAVQLWWDEDEDLLAKPWAKANGADSRGHLLAGNELAGDRVGVELRATRDVVLAGNRFEGVETAVDADESSAWSEAQARLPLRIEELEARVARLPGSRKAVGARPHLTGRDKIVMTEWGPYDWEGPYLRSATTRDGRRSYELLGTEPLVAAEAEGAVEVQRVRDGSSGPLALFVVPRERGRLAPYTLTVTTESATFERRGVALDAAWDVRAFAWTVDPREDVERWRAEAADAVRFTLPALDLPYGSGGPSQLAAASAAVREAGLPADRFGTLARTELVFPAGRWRVTVTSDDGVRVRVGERVVLEDWTWHAPRTESAVVEMAEETRAEVVVEHFELDGHAVLSVGVEPAE